MINTTKLNKKLTTKSIDVFVNPYNFQFYYCKLSTINDCFYIEKEIYLPKNWPYKWIVEQINQTKKEYHKNWYNGNEKWFNKFIVD